MVLSKRGDGAGALKAYQASADVNADDAERRAEGTPRQMAEGSRRYGRLLLTRTGENETAAGGPTAAREIPRGRRCDPASSEIDDAGSTQNYSAGRAPLQPGGAAGRGRPAARGGGDARFGVGAALGMLSSARAAEKRA